MVCTVYLYYITKKRKERKERRREGEEGWKGGVERSVFKIDHRSTFQA